MNTLSRGIIKEIALPENFDLSTEQSGGIGDSWLLSCKSRRYDNVEFALFYRGTPCAADGVVSFRKLLEAPKIVFNSNDTTDGDAGLIHNLSRVLGNASNNQITNKITGKHGPKFFLECLEVTELNQKNVLYVTGYFHGPEGEVDYHYMGVFIDASPEDQKKCHIEEVLFQAPDMALFRKFMPDFSKSLQSISWSEKSSQKIHSDSSKYKLQF